MAIIIPANSAVTAAYDVANSCRFNFGDSSYMHLTQSAPTDNLKWTANLWFKLGTQQDNAMLFSARPGDIFNVRLLTSGKLDMDMEVSSSHVARLTTNRLFRDPAAWYCLTVVYDSANASAGDRMRMYINGTEETSFSTDTNPSEDLACILNADGISMQIGRRSDGGYFDGYIAEFTFIDGQASTPSSFGEFDEDSPTIWKPKKVSGLTFGNNGFYLDFKDSANLGNDANGGTDFTEVNLAAADQATDTPTNNFCTMNPLDNYYAAGTFSEGNCRVSAGSASVYTWCTSTFGVSSGKWYWECKMISRLSAEQGITDRPSPSATTQAEGTTNTLAKRQDQVIYWNASTHATDWTALSDDDILMFALDLDNNKVWVGVNGTWEDSGDPTSGATGTGAISITAPASTTHGSYFVSQGHGGNSTAGDVSYNFGNPPHTISSGNADADGYGNFEYAVPSGFYALCTKNLAEYGG